MNMCYIIDSIIEPTQLAIDMLLYQKKRLSVHKCINSNPLTRLASYLKYNEVENAEVQRKNAMETSIMGIFVILS